MSTTTPPTFSPLLSPLLDHGSPYSWPQYESVVQKFSWQPGITPLSSPYLVATIIGGYLVSVYFVQHFLTLVFGGKGSTSKGKNGSSVRYVPLGPIPALHNLVLCVGSFAMFIGTLEAVLIDSERNKWLWGKQNPYTWLLCFPVGTRSRGRIFFWSYVYYLSKFYELLDTFILVLKRKPMSFLHVYHHATVIIMCYLWLEYQQSLQVIALLTNTGIHVIMYFYYFMHSIGCPPPWKKFVTNGQIVQFVFSFCASLPFIFLHFNPPAEFKGGCAGFYAWVFNALFNLSLLYLFADFHRKNYGTKGAKKGLVKKDTSSSKESKKTL